MNRPAPHTTLRGSRLALGCAAVLLLAVGPLAFAADPKPGPAPAAAAPAPPSAAVPKPVTQGPAQPARVKAAPAAPRKDSGVAPSPARRPVTPRTLDPVHIEGELDVPEVLFITARDQRRIVGFQHGRYLTGSAALARTTPLPSHVVVDRRSRPDSVEVAR